jgi:DNA-binding CsgD family transcriptional regulator
MHAIGKARAVDKRGDLGMRFHIHLSSEVIAMTSSLARDNAHLAKADRSPCSRPGLVLVDRSLKFIASNVEAIKILTFPASPKEILKLEDWLTKRITAGLVDRRSPTRLSFVEQFKSARRTYHCRPFPLNLNGNARVPQHPALVLLLERSTNEAAKLAEIGARFGLTLREQETVKLLFEGLTSKEIASRMDISPNTVRAFLRLVMVKMGVSTRSGILGKIAGSKR